MPVFSHKTKKSYHAGSLTDEARALSGNPPGEVGGGLLPIGATAKDVEGWLSRRVTPTSKGEVPWNTKMDFFVFTPDTPRILGIYWLVLGDRVAELILREAWARLFTWLELRIPVGLFTDEVLVPDPSKTALFVYYVEFVTREVSGVLNPHPHPHARIAPVITLKGGLRVVRQHTLVQIDPLVRAILWEELIRLSAHCGLDLLQIRDEKTLVRRWERVFMPIPGVGKNTNKSKKPLSETRAEWRQRVSLAKLPPLPPLVPKSKDFPPPLSDKELLNIYDRLGWTQFDTEAVMNLKALFNNALMVLPYWAKSALKVIHRSTFPSESLVINREALKDGKPTNLVVNGPKSGPRLRFVRDGLNVIDLKEHVRRFTYGVRIPPRPVVPENEVKSWTDKIRQALKEAGVLSDPQTVLVAGEKVTTGKDAIRMGLDKFKGYFARSRLRVGDIYAGMTRTVVGIVDGQLKLAEGGAEALFLVDGFDFYPPVPMEMCKGEVLELRRKVQCLAKDGTKAELKKGAFVRVYRVDGSNVVTVCGRQFSALWAGYGYCSAPRATTRSRGVRILQKDPRKVEVGKILLPGLFPDLNKLQRLYFFVCGKRAEGRDADQLVLLAAGQKQLGSSRLLGEELLASTFWHARELPDGFVVELIEFQARHYSAKSVEEHLRYSLPRLREYPVDRVADWFATAIGVILRQSRQPSQTKADHAPVPSTPPNYSANLRIF